MPLRIGSLREARERKGQLQPQRLAGLADPLVAASTPARVARWLLLLAIPSAGGIGLLAILTIGLIFLLVAMLAMVAAAVCWTVRVQPAQPPVPLTNSQA